VEQVYSGELVDLAESDRGVADILWPGTDEPIQLRPGEASADEHTQRFFAHATELMWQCCNGYQRNMWVQDDRDLLALVRRLLDWEAGREAFVAVKVDDQQQVLINPDKIDYLSVPGHRLRRALRA
jgi:hypothetical protein